MHAQTISHMFRGLSFAKSAAEIVEKAKQKITKLNAKIEERQQRVQSLRKEYEIDDAALVQLLTAARNQETATYRYTTSNSSIDAGPKMEEKVVGAGVVNNLLTENDFIEAEKDAIKTLDLIVRNLKPFPQWTENGTSLPDKEFILTQEELIYLGF